MNGIGDSNISPYLLQPLRTHDEVEEERARKKPATTPAKATPAPPPGTPAATTDSPAADTPGTKPGRRIDTSV